MEDLTQEEKELGEYLDSLKKITPEEKKKIMGFATSIKRIAKADGILDGMGSVVSCL